MDIEEGFKATKPCGRFQFGLQIIAIYIVLTTGYNGLFSFFIFDNPPWQCTQNATSKFCKKNNGTIFSSENKEFGRRCLLNRTDWSYITKINHSAVTEFDLICDKTPLAATGGAGLYIGGLFGAAASGKLADLYGRKPILVFNLFAGILVSIGCAYVKEVWQLIGLRCFLGAFYASYFTITLVYLMEFIAPKYRTIAGILYNTNFCFSLIIADIVAYHERCWRTLQIYMSLPSVLALVVFCFLPESPRWLLATGKKIKAEAKLKLVARFNGRKIPALTLKSVETNTTKKTYSYFSLFKNKKVALTTLSQGCIWMTSATIYYALGLESSSLGGDMYHVFAYSALAEIPSNMLAIFCCDRFGRKKSILGSLCIGGIITGLISIHLNDAKARFIYNLTFVFTGRLFITVSYNAVYVWAFEVFPTVVRSQGLCICAIFERIGGILSPYFVRVLQRINPVLPFVIMLCLALLTALFGFLILPETNKKPTRELFDDFYDSNKVDPAPPTNIQLGYVNGEVDEESAS